MNDLAHPRLLFSRLQEKFALNIKRDFSKLAAAVFQSFVHSQCSLRGCSLEVKVLAILL